MVELLKSAQVVGARRMLRLFRAYRLAWRDMLGGFCTTHRTVGIDAWRSLFQRVGGTESEERHLRFMRTAMFTLQP
jgi:hypothetical protein